LEENKPAVGVTGISGFVGKRWMSYNGTRFHLQPIPLRNTVIAQLPFTKLNAIVHLAGKAHQMEPIADEIYFQVNCDLALELARAAKDQGVRQFIYISTTKVYGESPKGILNEQSVCLPTDPYGASKKKAEELLFGMQSTNFSVAIVRPPLIYGAEVKGNMLKLLQLAAGKYPLPFGETDNLRSMVYIDNLIALINTIIEKKASGIFLAGDEKPLSTAELVGLMRKAMQRRPGLVAVPKIFRSILKNLRPALYTRLFGSFVADPTQTNQQLQFSPPVSSEQGITEMVNWFMENNFQRQTV
jgi:nucleoside-diphosphate-sugar epimerase